MHETIDRRGGKTQVAQNVLGHLRPATAVEFKCEVRGWLCDLSGNKRMYNENKKIVKEDRREMAGNCEYESQVWRSQPTCLHSQHVGGRGTGTRS